MLHGKERGCCSCGDAKLVIDVLNMVVNGTRGEREHGRHLVIRVATRNQPQHLDFAVTQLRYPLDDRTRQPMPAGGLFSTAQDVARFCRMMLNGGALDGKRYLSEASVQQMTHKQTGDAVKESYGFGLSAGAHSFGHGGAYATSMNIDTQSGLITVWMVQHAGFPGNGGDAGETFKKAADELFSSTRHP